MILQSFARKVIHIKEHFRRSRQNSTISKKLRTGRRLLKQILVSYEQNKKFKHQINQINLMQNYSGKLL